MKKLLALAGILLGLALFGGMVLSRVSASAFSNTNTNTFEFRTDSYYGGMMGGNAYDDTFERRYIHLSLEDQDAIDILFAERVVAADLNQLTVQETVDVIQDIKDELLAGFADLSNRPYYGMMGGGGMMGGSNIGNNRCGNSGAYIGSYEWYYIHTIVSERELVDVKFSELLKSVDLSTLSIEEVVDAITKIKEDVIIYLLDLRQTNN